LLENLGCTIGDYGIVPDTLDATRRTISKAALGHDLIVTSGGVSVGEEDHIRPAVEAQGRLNMWNIAIKPGKPLALGEIDRAGGTTPFIGLPGNPVSTFILFLLFVKPFILRLQGVQNTAPQAYSMRADFSWAKAGPRNEFLRARINPSGGLDLFANQSSGVLTSAIWGDGLIDNPPGRTIAPGDTVRFLPFNELLH
jgi:molybdopterin molybdotransferase